MRFTRWDQTLDYDKSITLLAEIQNFIEEQRPGIRQRIPDFPWDNPVLMLGHIFNYDSVSLLDAIAVRQVHALYAKFEPLKAGFDKEEVAWMKFKESEASCSQINIKLRSIFRGESYMPSDVAAIFWRAQRKIRSILGPVPVISDLKLRLGPGATTHVKKQNASITGKFSSRLACSESLMPYLTEVLYELPHLLPFEEEVGITPVDIVPGKLSFVPKDAKTYRAIVVEPMLNGLCQLGLHDYLARRLLAAGIDISQQTLNQRLAREGSITGALATLDLSSASDSISLELVYALLPLDWAYYLARYRSRYVEYQDQIICLEKFSSMGNGYTFALETIIFYALAWAACPRGATVNAYGDDIIIPSADYDTVKMVLEYFGFLINAKKSFSTGRFRESCGADYLQGIDIRPFYFKKLISCEDLFSLHNFAVTNGDYLLAEFIRDSYLDDSVVLWGPPGFGDGHLIDYTGFDWAKPHRRHDGWSGCTFETYSHKPRLDMKLRPGDRVLPTYSIYSRYEYPDADPPSYDGCGAGLTVKDGAPRCTLPGTLPGYKRIKIYTLDIPSALR